MSNISKDCVEHTSKGAGGARVIRDTPVPLRAEMGEEKSPWGSLVGWVRGRGS